MVIEDAICKIWEDEYEKYKDELQKINDLSTDEIFHLCKQDIIELHEQPFHTNMHTLTIMETIGCQHQIKNDKISGCSFCNWDAKRIRKIAHLASLQKQDSNKYAEAIKFSFQLIRGEQCNPNLIEQLSVHDILNEKQFPLEAYNIMFKDCGVYNRKPNIGIISARADSVTAEKIERWKAVFKRSLTVGIGIECGNEWIRNHWLNKNISNEKLIAAVECIQDGDCKVCANILLGLPGLSEDSSLALFYDTCDYILHTLHVDYVLISPLINKNKTLGAFVDGKDSTISTKLLINAMKGLVKFFSDHLSQITFSPDNLELMKQLKSGPELEELLLIYEKVDNMGTVYTTVNGMHCTMLDFPWCRSISIPKTEILKQDLLDCFSKINSKLNWNQKNKCEEFLLELGQLKLEELEWNRWNY